jgi:membrane protease YdiL (CAAX protease family)
MSDAPEGLENPAGLENDRQDVAPAAEPGPHDLLPESAVDELVVLEPLEGNEASLLAVSLASDEYEPAAVGEAFVAEGIEPAAEVALEAGPELGFAAGYPFVPEPPVFRVPNLVDATIFLVLLVVGLLVTVALLGLASYFHWLERWMGLKDIQAAATDTRVALGTQLLLYGIALAGAVPLFRHAWGKGYLAGLHWHAATAWRLKWRLGLTALLCNGLALAANAFLPQPDHPPIEKLFATPRDAWLLMLFGVLIAPFFEEMIFRGFLLPGVATAWDWTMERIQHTRPHPLDSEGNPVWSLGAMVFASMAISAPFALMHSAQLGAAWGPLLLLYCVSLALCAARLLTRSLAASTLVHATYNFLLFAVTFVQTDGFRHLDKV